MFLSKHFMRVGILVLWTLGAATVGHAESTLEPTPPSSSSSTGDICDNTGLNRAISFLRKKVEDDPLDEIAAGMLGYRLLEFMRRERRFEHLAEVQQLLNENLKDSSATSVQLLRASALKVQHRFLEALNEIDAMLKSSSTLKSGDLESAKLFRIDTLIELGRIDEAELEFSRSASVEDDALSGIRRARLLEGKGDLPASVRVGASILASESFQELPEYEAVWFRLQHGERLVRIGRLVEARAVYEGASKICPNYWLIDEHIAEVDAINGDKTKALATYLKLAEVKKTPGLFESVASLLSSVGRTSEARDMAERARKVYVGSVERGEQLYLHHLATLLDEQFDDSCAALEFASRDLAGRKTASTLGQTAWIAFRCGKRDRARLAIEEALGKSYSDPQFDYRAGVILSGLGDRVRGKELIARATRDNPWVNAFHAHR